MNQTDRGKEILRRRMADYEVPVGNDLWARIEQDLPPVAPAPAVLPWWRRRAVWGGVAAVALLCLMTGVTVGLWRETSEPMEDGALSTTTPATAPEPTTTPVPETEPTPIIPPIPSRTSSLLAHSAKETVQVSSRIGIPEEEECNLPVTQTPATDSETPQVAPKRTLSTPESDVASKEKETVTIPRRQASKSWSFGVSTGGGLLASSKTMDGYVAQSTTTFSSVQGPVFMSRTASPFGSMDRAVYLANTLAGEEASTEWHHQTPVTWGLSIRKMLSKRMAIESGVTYTQLSSTCESGSSRNYNTGEQKLHYVGIPVRVSYQWWNSRRLSVYTTAGGALEKCVDGKLTRSWSLSSIVPGTQPLVQTEKESVQVNALQASVTAAAGIQLNLAPQIGAYVEPGIAYYFDDKSGVETIRKSHPLNLHIEVGLRWIPGEK